MAAAPVLKILIVEDLPSDAELAERELRRGGFVFDSTLVDARDSFLQALEEFQPDLIISDYAMPEFDGMEALQLTLKRDTNLPLIILTGSMNEETAVECMKAGAADYVIKEHITRLPYAVKGALERKEARREKAAAESRLRQAYLELSLAYDATIEGWARALEMRDYETEGHTRRVAELTVDLAAEMDIPEQQLVHIRRGALLHDIGKMGIPDAILFKPGKLTEEEWDIMRRHPVMAYEMLSGIDYLKPAINIPYCHHEKWDGSGYPRGMKGEEIPLEARIFCVIDVFDALTSDRPYRSAWNREQALEYIQRERGSHFDPRVADLFLSKMIPEG